MSDGLLIVGSLASLWYVYYCYLPSQKQANLITDKIRADGGIPFQRIFSVTTKDNKDFAERAIFAPEDILWRNRMKGNKNQNDTLNSIYKYVLSTTNRNANALEASARGQKVSTKVSDTYVSPFNKTTVISDPLYNATVMKPIDLANWRRYSSLINGNKRAFGPVTFQGGSQVAY